MKKRIQTSINETEMMGVTRRNLVKSAVAMGLSLPLLSKSSGSAAPRIALRRQDAQKQRRSTCSTPQSRRMSRRSSLRFLISRPRPVSTSMLDSQPYDALQQKVFAELAVIVPITTSSSWTLRGPAALTEARATQRVSHESEAERCLGSGARRLH